MGGKGGGAAGLSALLAGRSRRQKCEPKTQQKLQKEALHLLSTHQNLDDLLLEVGSSLCDEPKCPTISSAIGGETSVPEQLVESALQDRAATLEVPVGVLAARTAADNVKKILAEAGEAVLLNAEQREKVTCLLQTLKDLLAQNAFCRLPFTQEMWKVQSPPLLEVAWHLHREGIVSLEELIESHPEATGVVDWLSDSLRLLCHQAQDPSPAAGPLGAMLTDFAAVFLRNGFKKTELGKKTESAKLYEISCAVLERMLAWVLDSVAQERREEASRAKAVTCWLHVFSTAAYQGRVPPESLQSFFSHTLTQVLTCNPQLKVSDAVNLQREWCFARTSPILTTLYRKLFVSFQAEELIRQLQKVLETSEVNWHHVLSCVSTLLVCHSEAEALVQDFLGRLLKKAFEDYDLENMVTAFLIARQAALEGPAIFMPYSEWFKAAFGNASSFHCTSKKALVFLFKFLSELVPFEAPQYLKVHIMHAPFVPTKCRPFLLEYIALAKTRLADFKVSIEDMGLYEDLSTAKEDGQPLSQALQDVEKAVQIFENTGRIPASVMEASIFRRPYYTSRFLPALLTPRVLPEMPDSRMALIDALKRAEKIPLNMYAMYLEGCRAAKEKFFQSGSTEMEASDLQEPLELLKAELGALRLLIVDPSKHEGVPAQIAVVSEKLVWVSGHPDDVGDAASLSLRIQLDLSAPEVEQQHQGVVDLLLTSFSQNVMAASHFLPPDRQGSWPSLFVRMIAGHRPLLPALLGRLCQLLCYQGPSLSAAHLIGLAVFAIHLNDAESLIPAVDVCSRGVPHSASGRGLCVTALWEYFLTCRSGESVAFCMRFCTAALSYVLCKFVSLSHEGLCSFLRPAFVKKLQYAVPRLCVAARGVCGLGSAEGLPWATSSRPGSSYKEAALGLWKEPRFQRLLQEEAFQLTLQEWLRMELGVSPEEDLLSASERQAFHYWALYQHFLPRSTSAGGCDGDLRKACAHLTGAILDSHHRSELNRCGPLKNPEGSQWRGNSDLYFRLQEMLLELELVHRRRARREVGSGSPEEPFLFRLFQGRLKSLGNGAALGERLCRQQERLLQTRILLGLPPSVLIATRRKGARIALDCEGFFCFVNTELRNACPRGSTLPYDVTAHFFRGLLSASLECDHPAGEVTAALALCQARCPLILSSAARWWQAMEPALSSEWERLFGGPLAQGLQNLEDLQVSVSRFLSSEAPSLAASDTPWLSAAFLHFAFEGRALNDKRVEALKRLGPRAEEVLVHLLLFSVVDLITAKVAPQEGVEAPSALDWSTEVLRGLEERHLPWLALFCSSGTGHSPGQILRGAVSEEHMKLLPVAFYSLLPALDAEDLAREQMFLYVATDMYAQLLQLFMDGPEEVGPLPREPRLGAHKPEDSSLVLVQTARQFLLRAIPRCPPGSFSNLQALLDLCGVLDPEVQAALVHFGPGEELMDDEPLLF